MCLLCVASDCNCDSGGYCPDDNLHYPPIACEACVESFRQDKGEEPSGYMGSQALFYIGQKVVDEQAVDDHRQFMMQQAEEMFMQEDDDLPF
jgi:hypothetical protein